VTVAQRQSSLLQAATRYRANSSGYIPSSEAQALALLHLTKARNPDAAFAGRGELAALALPQPAGGCVFVRFGLAPVEDRQGGSLWTSSWPAPTQASCTAVEALTEAGFVTADPHAGG
jgi:hypothetical protein